MRLDKITTAHDEIAVRRAKGYRRYIMACIETNFAEVPNIPWHKTRGSVKAHIVAGMWAVKCPLHEQQSVVFAEPGEPFFCPLCLMMTNDGLPMTVLFPKNRAEIEEVLVRRPHVATRNWTPQESVFQLVMENVQHGVEPPTQLAKMMRE